MKRKMIKGIFHSAAGMMPRMSQQEVVANNLANINTTGFKSDYRRFRTTLNNLLLQGGPGGEPISLTEEMFYLQTDFSSGSVIKTHNPLDLAIVGKGFFNLETGDVVSYSRNGNLTLNQDNELINNQGYIVLGEAGPIRITGTDVLVLSNGDVVVDGERIDTIKITYFNEPLPLRRNGYGYFVPTIQTEGFAPEDLKIEQGALEASNVDPILMMIQMIELNRDYESCQKAVHAQDETLKKVINEL